MKHLWVKSSRLNKIEEVHLETFKPRQLLVHQVNFLPKLMREIQVLLITHNPQRISEADQDLCHQMPMQLRFQQIALIEH
jgi:hypothetical protein